LRRYNHDFLFRSVLLDLRRFSVFIKNLHGAALIRVDNLSDLHICEVKYLVDSFSAQQIASIASELVGVRHYVVFELISL
jgi:hypothetical protein